MTTLSTVGYGDISASTKIERIFAIMAQLFGCFLFGVLLGTLNSVMLGQKLLDEKSNRQLAELREFLDQKNVPKRLRRKVRDYMEHLYMKKTAYDERVVLEQLPPAMAKELLDHMYRRQVINVPLFTNLDEQVLAKLCFAFRPYAAMQNDFIYREGEVSPTTALHLPAAPPFQPPAVR